MRSARSLIDTLSIRTKIALGAGVIALASWALLAVFSYATTDLLLDAASKQMFQVEGDYIASEFRATYEPVERITSVLSSSQLAQARTEQERLAQVPLLVDVLRQVPAAAAIQIGDERGDYFIVRTVSERLRKLFDAPQGSAFEADLIDGESRSHRRWFYDDTLKLIASRELPASDYDPRIRPWYARAVFSPAPVRTPPYVFFFMSEIGMTVARATADRRAVVATDVTLTSLSRALAARRVTPSSASVVLDAQGVLAWSGSVPGLVEQAGNPRRRTLAELGHPALAALAEGRVLDGWLIHRTGLGVNKEMASELVIVVPEDELLADVRARQTRMLALSALALALLIPLAWVFAYRISTPLRGLHRAIARVVSSGDFDFWLPEVRSRDEVGDLNIALRTMRSSLKKHIEDLAAAIAARERLAGELEIAARIQMSFLPGGGQYSKQLPGARVFARVIPARAVGGDLYDVIEYPDGRFFVAVGDVSDKGTPAALLMARVMTLAKLLVPSVDDLAWLASALNKQLEEGNRESMFITFFGAIIDLRTGEVRCVSAGHNPPVIVGEWGIRVLAVESGRPLGLFESSRYVESTFQLQPGERLVLYTDGVTEAFDKDRNEFGEARLVALLEKAGMMGSADELGAAIFGAVSAFAGEAPQSDDITVLIVDRT